MESATMNKEHNKDKKDWKHPGKITFSGGDIKGHFMSDLSEMVVFEDSDGTRLKVPPYLIMKIGTEMYQWFVFFGMSKKTREAALGARDDC